MNLIEKTDKLVKRAKEPGAPDRLKDAALLFRQSLYANLEQSQFRVMERYLVDALLEQNNITQPEQFKAVNPIRLGEILGADAVLLITMNIMCIFHHSKSLFYL